MPIIGEIKRGHEIGRGTSDWHKNTYGLEKYIWHACEECGKERWVRLRKPFRHFCQRCGPKQNQYVHSKNPFWRGGRVKIHGYVMLYISKDNFYYPMANKIISPHGSYILEHRLVMASSLGRLLQPWELIHHKNGIRDDNRLENLELQTKDNHIRDHSKGYQDGYRKGLIDGRSTQIKNLKNKIAELEVVLNG